MAIKLMESLRCQLTDNRFPKRSLDSVLRALRAEKDFYGLRSACSTDVGLEG